MYACMYVGMHVMNIIVKFVSELLLPPRVRVDPAGVCVGGVEGSFMSHLENTSETEGCQRFFLSVSFLLDVFLRERHTMRGASV